MKVPNYTLVRPFGASDIPEDDLSPNLQEKCVYYSSERINKHLSNWAIGTYKLDVISLPRYYGGPKTLAKYKCFIYLPVSSSTS